MPHVTGEERNQLFMISMEEMVPKDSFVRTIDSFVDAIDSRVQRGELFFSWGMWVGSCRTR